MRLEKAGITPEIRREALQILSSGKPNAYAEIEKLLGCAPQLSIPGKEMARLLGISYYRLQYLLDRNYLREKQKRLTIARGEATSVAGRIVASQKLKFCCWLPNGWCVDCEDESVTNLSEEVQSRYKEWLSSLERRDLRKEYLSLQKQLQGALVPFDQFAESVNLDIESKKQAWQDRLAAKIRQGFQVGYWSASSGETQELAAVEVTKFHFRQGMTAVELYKAEKPEPDDLSSGTRPRQTFAVDGMEAVRFYCLWRDTDNAQFSTYAVDGLTGWVIDCWSNLDDPFRLRPLFQRIVSTFHRL